jgi:hypothetical protein
VTWCPQCWRPSGRHRSSDGAVPRKPNGNTAVECWAHFHGVNCVWLLEPDEYEWMYHLVTNLRTAAGLEWAYWIGYATEGFAPTHWRSGENRPAPGWPEEEA